MSGGGSGPGSKHSKEKYRTVKCRDWEAKGDCPYGEFCSFLHDDLVRSVQGDEGLHDSVKGEVNLSLDSTVPPTLAGRPKSFNGSNIIVPDLRWTQDDGLTVSNPTTATKPNFRDVADKLVQTISKSLAAESDATRGNNGIASPATQYASIPPRSAWNLGPPRMLAPSSAVQGVSPDLPISAYTFSTDSPGTPYDPANDHHEGDAGASDSDGSEEAIDIAQTEQHAAVLRKQEISDEMLYRTDMVLPPYIQPVHDYAAYPWPIERLYPQAVSATWDAILKDPSQLGPQGKDLELEARKLVAQKLARMVKGGRLPPQQVQERINYRSESHERSFDESTFDL